MPKLTQKGLESLDVFKSKDSGTIDPEDIACCSNCCIYGIVLGFASSYGAVGASILASSIPQIVYSESVAASTIGAAISYPVIVATSTAICRIGGDNTPSAGEGNDSVCANILINQDATSKKCSLGNSVCEYLVALPVKTAGYASVYNVIGSLVKGTTDAAALGNAAAVGATGGAVVGTGIGVLCLSYKYLANEDISLCECYIENPCQEQVTKNTNAGGRAPTQENMSRDSTQRPAQRI